MMDRFATPFKYVIVVGNTIVVRKRNNCVTLFATLIAQALRLPLLWLLLLLLLFQLPCRYNI